MIYLRYESIFNIITWTRIFNFIFLKIILWTISSINIFLFLSDCTGPPIETDPCALPFSILSLGDSKNYEKFNDWRQGDNHLDWFGEEVGQGYHNGQPASGTPLAWTTSTAGVDGYQEVNM